MVRLASWNAWLLGRTSRCKNSVSIVSESAIPGDDAGREVVAVAAERDPCRQTTARPMDAAMSTNPPKPSAARESAFFGSNASATQIRPSKPVTSPASRNQFARSRCWLFIRRKSRWTQNFRPTRAQARAAAPGAELRWH